MKIAGGLPLLLVGYIGMYCPTLRSRCSLAGGDRCNVTNYKPGGLYLWRASERAELDSDQLN